MKKYIIIMASALILTIGVYMVRKEFPYDIEIVPSDRALWIVNLTDWADRDCMVSVKGNGGDRRVVLLSAKSSIINIDGLINGVSYKIDIGRQDLLGRIRYRKIYLQGEPSCDIKKYVVLIGASVGKSWNLPGLSKRMNDKSVSYGYRCEYEFDKSSVINRVINSQLKPDAAIIKECAAYFPREIEESIRAVENWAQSLRNVGILPILATVVPVTKSHDTERKPSRMESINRYNEAIRGVCARRGFYLLDLQKVLSNSKDQGYLDDKFAASDGLHLREDTYRYLLDEYLVNFIHMSLLK
jgi:hypothetical protein